MWAKSSLDNYKRSVFLGHYWFGTRCHCKDKGTGTVFSLGSSLFANFIEVVPVVRSGVKVRPNTTGEQLLPLCSSFSQEDSFSIHCWPLSLSSSHTSIRTVSWEKDYVGLGRHPSLPFSNRDLPACREQATWCAPPCDRLTGVPPTYRPAISLLPMSEYAEFLIWGFSGRKLNVATPKPCSLIVLLKIKLAFWFSSFQLLSHSRF